MIRKMVIGYRSIALFCAFLVSFISCVFSLYFSCKAQRSNIHLAKNTVQTDNLEKNTFNEKDIEKRVEDVMAQIREKNSEKSDLTLESKSAILMEGSNGNIIFEKDAHKKVNPASITKIMTLLLIYEHIDEGKIKGEDVVTVSEYAASMGGSQVFLEVGETQTVETMIKCISIASANDAAVAMAEHIAGSEEAFVSKMNRRAKELGMKNTHFVNCCGLDVDGHMSSAYDVAIMSKELMTNYPEIIKYTTTWMDTIIHKTRKGESEFGLTNTNKLVRTYKGITGLKTGSTSKAKYCLSATANKEGIDMIAVVMSAPDHKLRFTEASKLLDYGFSKCNKYEHKYDNEKLKNIKIKKGVRDTINGVVKDSFKYVDVDDIGKISYKKVINHLEAPINKGDKIGVIEYFKGEEKIGERHIVAKEGVKRADFIDFVSQLCEKMRFN